jgi:hypothetical protein
MPAGTLKKRDKILETKAKITAEDKCTTAVIIRTRADHEQWLAIKERIDRGEIKGQNCLYCLRNRD